MFRQLEGFQVQMLLVGWTRQLTGSFLIFGPSAVLPYSASYHKKLMFSDTLVQDSRAAL